jgi:tetratricopeptide (TPR) repeat protein
LNYVLALKYAEMKNPKIIALCDSLIRADSADVHAEPYYYKGIYFSNTGDKEKALSLFNDAVQKDYYFLDGYIEKAALLFDLKRFPDAIKTLTLALTISPQFADAYYWLGRCLEATGQKEDARLNYQKAVGLDPTLTEAKEGIQRLGN